MFTAAVAACMCFEDNRNRKVTTTWQQAAVKNWDIEIDERRLLKRSVMICLPLAGIACVNHL